MAYRVALASSDGIVVNRHFGKADTFLVFEQKNNDFEYVEKRMVTPCCVGGNHADGGFDEAAKALADCSAVVVGKIGSGAADYLNARGFEVYEAPFPVNAVLKELIRERGI